ncbi:MAG: hypothetical protein GY793_04255 [Proteobacteria bacterium]|nr:hypothetical protein [Pseudomonadota bacterium]
MVSVGNVDNIDGVIQDIEQAKDDLFDKLNRAETSQEKQSLNNRLEKLHGKSDEAEKFKKGYQDLMNSANSFNGKRFRTVSDAQSAEGEFLSNMN